MRNLYFFSILCCLTIVSCQQDTEIIDNETTLVNNSTQITENEASNEGKTELNNLNRGGGAGFMTEAENFEGNMAWASYITAKIIYDHANDAIFKYELTNLINNQTVSLGDLIGPNSQFPGFNTEFEIFLGGYIDGIWCPDDEEETPNGVVITDPINTTGLMTTAQLVDHYLDYMLNDNCVELYFPLGVHAGEAKTASVAHPLTASHANNGFNRIAFGCGASTTGVWIPPNYVFINRYTTTFVVARPMRGFSIGSCIYGEYSGINFTDFLAGPF